MSKFVITLVVFSLYSMSFASTPPIRQELGNNWQFRQYHIGKWLPAEVPGTVPVSYTHLDVYKRQTQHFDDLIADFYAKRK